MKFLLPDKTEISIYKTKHKRKDDKEVHFIVKVVDMDLFDQVEWNPQVLEYAVVLGAELTNHKWAFIESNATFRDAVIRNVSKNKSLLNKWLWGISRHPKDYEKEPKNVNYNKAHLHTNR